MLGARQYRNSKSGSHGYDSGALLLSYPTCVSHHFHDGMYKPLDSFM